MSLGETLMAGALVQGAQRDTQMAYREINRLNGEIEKANRAYSELVNTYQNYVSHARAQIHYHRSALTARRKVEALMCEAIATLDPSNALTSFENVQRMVEQQISKSIRDPKVINMTYAEKEIHDIEKHIQTYYVDNGDEDHPDLVIRQKVT